MKSMDALVLLKHGSLEHIAFDQVPMPAAGPEEVLVEIKAAALNRLDLWVVEGWRGLNLQFPHILGSDGAGVVTEVGDRVEGFKPGDRVTINPTTSCGACRFCIAGQDNICDEFAVFGEHVPGFFGKFQAVPMQNLLHLPPKVSFERAAAASLVYVTAWHSLISAGQFKAGEEILIIGAGGGVNSAYIDIAKFAGAGRIFVVGSTNEKLKLARKLGADVLINRNEVAWDKAIYQETGRQGVDVVVDNVGQATFSKSLRTLRKGGRLLTVGNSTGPVIEIDNRFIFGKHLQLIGTTMGPRKDYEEVMKLVFSGQLRPEIDSIYPLSDGRAALSRLEKGDVAGKLLLRP